MTAPQTVVVTTRNTSALTMGIIAIVLGVLALMFGWVPFLGLFSIPVAILGGLLAGIGLFLAMCNGGARAAGLPMLGGVICAAAIVLPIVSTGWISYQFSGIQQRAEMAREAADYKIDHLAVLDVSSKHAGGALQVAFRVHNRGERSLDTVNLKVQLRDRRRGVLVAENAVATGTIAPRAVWQAKDAATVFQESTLANGWENIDIYTEIDGLKFTQVQDAGGKSP